MTNDTHDIIRAWDAFVAPTERVALRAATGRVAASTIRQYPPGIPEIIPGMRYSSQTIDKLKTAHAAGSDIIGVDMETCPEVEVLSDNLGDKNPISICTYDAETLPADVVLEIADYFGRSFCRAPYFHFAFHESDPLQSLPHSLDFDAYTVSVALSDPEKRRICQETLREAAFQRAMKTPPLEDLESVLLPTGFHLWTDKGKCRTLIQDRLTDPGYVTLVRHSASGELKGLLHSRMGTVERLFQSEEWSNPLLFSAYEDERFHDDPKRFFDKITYHFGLNPTDPLMTISAQVLNPDIQGGDVFYKMMKSMAQKISPAHAALPLASEIPPHGTAHTLNTALNDRLVFGILKNDHPIVFCAQMSQALFLITGDKKHWNYALRTAAREKRQYRTQYYISQPTDETAVVVKPNGKSGLAVFATKNIPAGTRIAIFSGETYHSDTALGLPEIMRDHAIQVGPKEYVFGYKGLAHRLCHSCDPNCGIRNKTEIFTIRDIARDEQLTWDYRCSENSNWVLERCLCGADRCTGVVGNFDSLPAEMKCDYLAKSMVSEWITSAANGQDGKPSNSAV